MYNVCSHVVLCGGGTLAVQSACGAVRLRGGVGAVTVVHINEQQRRSSARGGRQAPERARGASEGG